ncbi:MAG: hypothetical protein ACKVVP_06280 [Chloroflexota bacterium]
MSTAAPAIGRIWKVRAEAGGTWHTWARAASLTAAIAAFGIAMWQGTLATVLVGILALVVGWVLVGVIWRGPERDFALTIYASSMGIRLLAGALGQIFLARTNGFLFEDDRAYDEIAWRVVEVWRGDRAGIHKSDNYLLVNYTYLLAGLYNVIGHELLAAKWLNALVGALASVATFALALHLTGVVGARLAAVAMTLFPSLVFWSALNLKDTWVVLLIVLAIYGTIRFAESATRVIGPASLRDLIPVSIAAGTLLAFNTLENLRLYVYFALGWLMPITFFVLNRSDLPRKLAYGLSFAVITVMLTVGTHWGGFRFIDVKRVEATMSNRVLIAEKAETGLDLPKPPKGVNPYLYQLEQLPMGIAHVLGAPFPWTVKRVKDLPTIPEMVGWYAMLSLALLGLATRFRHDWRRLLMPLLFTGMLVTVLGLVEGNVGTIFRHRAMLMPTVFVAAGIGLTWLLARRKAPQGHTEVKVGL